MTVTVHDAAFETLIEPNAAVERLATGFGFTEGALWDDRNARLIFSDMPHDHMRCWSQSTGITTFRKPSNKANGNVFDHQGRLVTCEHSTSRVVRLEDGGALKVLATHYDGKELNSPNDIVVKRDGAIYFSDPVFGRGATHGLERACELPFRGVYRIAPDGSLSLLADDFEAPNGLCFSPDENFLYINDTPKMHIRVFEVLPDGTLANGRLFATLSGKGTGKPDGMKVDVAGNIWCTGPGGIHVVTPQGREIGAVAFPERVANFCWGEGDRRSIFAAATTSLYRVRTKVAGLKTD